MPTRIIIGDAFNYRVEVWLPESYERPVDGVPGVRVTEPPADGRPPMPAVGARSLSALLIIAATTIERWSRSVARERRRKP